MSEQITAGVISGVNPVNIDINQTASLSGGNETKNVVEGTVGNRRVSLVEREFDDKYIANWHAFKEAGLPVVPTLRKSSKGTLLQTDVKSDGSEVYGKAVYRSLSNPVEVRDRPRENIDQLFLLLTQPASFPEIQKRAREYVTIANKNKIRLPYDDAFELIIHPDGTWDFITLDLRYAEKYEAGSNPLHVQEATERNIQAVDNLLVQLQYIRRELLKRSKPNLAAKIKQLLRKIK